jgi:hypothetical protein
MKINLEINNKDEAVEAINFLNVYVGGNAEVNVNVNFNEVVATKECLTVKCDVEVEEIVKPKKEKNKGEVVGAFLDSGKVVEAVIEEVKETVLIEEPEEVVTSVKTRKVKKDVITVISLTAKAKEAVTIVGKDKVTEKIKQYGERISAVDEADYESLNDDLIALIEG